MTPLWAVFNSTLVTAWSSLVFLSRTGSMLRIGIYLNTPLDSQFLLRLCFASSFWYFLVLDIAWSTCTRCVYHPVRAQPSSWLFYHDALKTGLFPSTPPCPTNVYLRFWTPYKYKYSRWGTTYFCLFSTDSVHELVQLRQFLGNPFVGSECQRIHWWCNLTKQKHQVISCQSYSLHVHTT